MANKLTTRTKSFSDTTTARLIEPIRKVFLAGLGAASMARTEGMAMFDRLVAEGEKFEKKTRKALKERREEAAEQISTLTAKVPEPATLVKKALKRVNEPIAYHLLPKGEGWTIRREGSHADISVHTTKDAALDAGRGLAHAHEPSRLVVHRADGTIQTSFSYGEDA